MQKNLLATPSAPEGDQSTPPRIYRLIRPFQEFARIQASSGILLLLCTILTLLWANSPWADT